MNTRWKNALALVASIAMSAMIWFGPLGVLWLSHIGTKAWASDRCGAQCTVEIPYGYPDPAADLVPADGR
jgi:hypothetical protein